MKYIKYLTAAVVFMLIYVSGIYAMPPHPDIVTQMILEGRNGEVREKVPDDLPVAPKSLISKSVSISRSYPSSGTFRVPVLLVRYGTAYPAEVLPVFKGINLNNFFNDGFRLIPAISFIVLFFLFINRKSIYGRRVATLYVFSVAFIVSCGVDPASEDDVAFPTDISLYSGILNGSSTVTISAKKYFSDMSNGNLNVQFDFYGPVQVSKAWDYYGANSGGIDAHAGELVEEAVRLMVSKYSNTDFSIYDQNHDGRVDTVIILHEGPGEESSGVADTIWSHEFDLYSANVVYGDGNGPVFTDGVWFNTYAIVPEYTTTRGDSTMGVFCHELGHALGLPDLYDTTNATYGVGDWSLMGSGSWGGTPAGSRPAPLLAWERNYLGGSLWVTITPLTAFTDNQSIDNLEVSRTAYKVMLDNSSGQEQYFILEGRKQSAAADWYVPGTGILITHIHEGAISAYKGTNEVNDGTSRVHGVNIIEAHGGSDLWSKANKGTAADLFVTGLGITNAIKYTDNTTYALSSTAATTVDIQDVQVTAGPPLVMSFDYNP